MGSSRFSYLFILKAAIILCLVAGFFSIGMAQYCTATYSNTSDEWISRVRINGMDNSSGSNSYTFYNYIPASAVVAAGGSYTCNVWVSVKQLATYTEHATVYFDWNQDNDFSDAGERFYMGSQSITGGVFIPGTKQFSVTVNVPGTAYQGLTRMRVIMKYNSAPPTNGCQSGTFGEVEDYNIYVDGGNCSPGGGREHSQPSASQSVFPCGSGTATLNASGISAGNNAVWYSSATATTPLFIGNPYQPTISSSQTYYVAQESRFSPFNTSIGGGRYYTPFTAGLAFTVSQNATLGAVTVYPNSAGVVVVRLLNGSGGFITSRAITVTGSGARRIVLGFNLTPGNYRLDASGSTVGGLYRNDSGVSFPYSNNQVSITGGAGTGGAAGNYYFFYHWEVEPGKCPSFRRAVTATVNPIPVITSRSGGFTCGNGTVTLSATADLNGTTLNWYEYNGAYVFLGSGASFTTPTITADKFFYVRPTKSGCDGGYYGVFADWRPIPANPTTGVFPERCGPGQITLNAGSPSGGIINWYDAQTGGNFVTSGTSYSPTISSTTTYYAEVVLNGCTSTGRTTITGTINPSPPAPTPMNTQRCGIGQVTLSASAAFGITWFNQPTGGTAVNSGPNYTLTVTDTTTFWVETFDGKCTSNRNAVTAIVDTFPNSPGQVIGDTLCGPGAATLNATGSGGTLNWYDAVSGGTQIGSGNTLTVNPMQTTSYWVEQVDSSGCKSGRAQTDVIVYAIPPDPTATGDNLCGPNQAILTAASSVGALNWYDDPMAGTLLATGNTYSSFEIATITYYVATVANGCFSTRVPATVTVNPVPPTPSLTMGDTLCGPGKVNLMVSQSGGIVLWQDSAINGKTLHYGNAFSPTLTQSTTFYVREGYVRNEMGVPLPGHVKTSPGAATGYWFQAPDDLLLTGFRVPTDASVAPNQDVLVVRLLATPNPTTPSAPAFEVLGTYPQVASATLITDSIPVLAGSYLGIIGIRGGENSLATAGPQTSELDGAAVTLSSLALGGGTVAAPTSLVATPAGEIGRVEMYFKPICLSGQTQVTGIITPIPPAPMVTTDSTCGSDTVNLSAIGTTGTLRWFNVDSAGSTLQKGPAFRPFITQDTTFWVEELVNGCIGPRTPVNVAFFAIPDPPVLTSDTICGPGAATLSATSPTGTISWYSSPDSTGMLLHTGSTYTPTLTDTTSFWVAYSDANCTSTRKQVTALVNAIPAAPQAFDVQVCGNDTAAFTASGSGGILIWYDVPAGGTALDTGTTFMPFLQNDKLYYVEEKRDGCTGTRTLVEGLVNTVPNPPDVLGEGICDQGQARLRASAFERVIDWYVSDTAKTPIFRGTDYTVFVQDTTTLWVQVAGATVEKVGPVNNQLGSGGMSVFYSDGINFDVLNPTTLKDVTVYVQDSGKVNIRLLDRTGKVQAETDSIVSLPGEHTIRLNFALLPGIQYHLDAVGTTTGGLFRNNENAQYPYAGTDIVLTGSFNGKDDYHYFFYNWEVGNCESKRVPVSAVAYPKASRSPVFPAMPASYTASYECLDDEGWTNYFYDLETPEKEDDLLLFSILKDGQDIGRVGDGTFRLRTHASDQAAAGMGLATQIQAPYVTNVQGWWVMNRYWEITPTAQPQKPIRVRYYYTEEDLAEINNALLAAGDSSGVTHKQLIPYIFLEGNPNPEKGHTGVTFGNFRQYINGDEGIGIWTHGTNPAFNYAEFEVETLLGGGAGKGGGDKGALSSGSLSVTPAGSFAILDWKAVSGLGGDHFEIEKSLDGITYSQIGTLPFNNDSIKVVDYTFTDKRPEEQLIYYRVKFIFSDSNFTYTNVVSIPFNKAANGLVKLYPNPTDGNVFMEFSNVIGSATIRIIDANGRIKYNQTITEEMGLKHTVRMQRMAVGIYFYEIRFQDQTQTGKIYKIH